VKALRESATQVLNTLSFGAFMLAGLTSEINIKQELQRYPHYPFMSSDDWWNNTSFPFYKVDKSHKGHCYRHGLRHSFHSGFRLAQLPAEHYPGSKLSTAAAELEQKAGVSAEDGEGRKERNQKGK